jgi:hypothetical protein
MTKRRIHNNWSQPPNTQKPPSRLNFGGFGEFCG